MASNQQTTNEKFEKFTWTINNFSTLESNKEYRESFTVAGYQWKILMFPKNDTVDGLVIHLLAYDSANLPQGRRITASVKLSVINPRISTLTKTIETQMQLSADDNQRFVWFVSSNALDDGFIHEDNLIIIAELCVKESGHEDQLDHGAGITDPMKSGFQDFRGLGKIEKDFIQLLEEVCSKHPTLIESQVKRNRSQRFSEWSFTALGRVLHFLKTKKVKDMNDDTCKELQILWEELETFGFEDLTWLEPRVQSALGMRNYVERATQVKKLKQIVAAWEIDLETARKELVKAEEGFEERQLDDELGY